jgi:FkbM family methyltransferase
MDYTKFLSHYSTEFLSNMDCDLHKKMLDKYFNLFPNKEKLVFFDIGCNAGSFLKTSKTYSNTIEFHCFEPHPELYNFLSKEYKECKINNICVSEYNGTCKINIPSLSVGISSIMNRSVFEDLKNSQEIYKLDVECITLDSYCKNNNIEKIDYIKIDVEGAEFMVLKGCLNLLKDKKINAGQFEVGIEKEFGISKEEIILFLENNGYKVNSDISTDYLFYKI